MPSKEDAATQAEVGASTYGEPVPGDHQGTETPEPDERLRYSIDLAARGQLTASEASVRSLLRNHPSYAPATLHLARVLLANGRAEEAARVMNSFVADRRPQGTQEVEALLLLADAESRTGRPREAEASGRRALALAPWDPRAKFAVAIACQQTNRLQEALELFESGLLAQPGVVHAWINRGLIEKQLGLLDQAVASFSYALSLNPGIAPAHYSLGLIHLLRGMREAAEHAFRKTLDIDPRHDYAAMQLATLLRYENRMSEAADVYRTILQSTPENVTARFLLDSMEKTGGPHRVPPEVVQAIYADESVGRSLEGSLHNHLRYQTPVILQAALQKLFGSEQQTLEVLDAGCGSGLYGTLVRPRAKRLTGVDLSAAMIDECRCKGVYTELHIKDVVDYLAETQERFDLVVAMDVFCYFGDLRPLIRQCAAILKPNGILACSVENTSEDTPWQFHRYGHFLHSSAHVRDAANAAGLHEESVTECALRHELGEDRMGIVALFSAPKKC